MSQDDRVTVAAQTFLQIAKDAGWWISPDGRIGFADAATLLGLAIGTLKNKCAQGAGPKVYALGGQGPDGRRHRRSIHLLDLAEWRESKSLDRI